MGEESKAIRAAVSAVAKTLAVPKGPKADMVDTSVGDVASEAWARVVADAEWTHCRTCARTWHGEVLVSGVPQDVSKKGLVVVHFTCADCTVLPDATRPQRRTQDGPTGAAMSMDEDSAVHNMQSKRQISADKAEERNSRVVTAEEAMKRRRLELLQQKREVERKRKAAEEEMASAKRVEEERERELAAAEAQRKRKSLEEEAVESAARQKQKTESAAEMIASTKKSGSEAASQDDVGLCGFCFSWGVEAFVNSKLCVEAQVRLGCHVCMRKGCWEENSKCPDNRRPGSASCEMQLSYSHRLKHKTASMGLRTFLRGLFGNPDRDVLQIKDAGGGGDCLFHATAAALENMLQYDIVRPHHALHALSFGDFGRGSMHMVQILRGLAAERIMDMTNEDFLNFVVSSAQQKMSNAGWYDLWNPVRLLRLNGFDMLHSANVQDVLVAQPETRQMIDLMLKFRWTDHTECLKRVRNGMDRLHDLRQAVIDAFSACGNVHWGTVTDVAALADALDIGFIVFSNNVMGGNRWVYGIHTQKNVFPYWITLYCCDNVHFQLAEIYEPQKQAYTCFFPDDRLPVPLREHWGRCNYAPRFHGGIS